MGRMLAVSIALAAGLSVGASAAEGRIPLLSLPGPPFVISTPGHYILTRDFEFTGGDVVRIMTGGVTLDLGGHTLAGSAGGPGATIAVLAPASSRGITIRNGRITGGTYGVLAAPGDLLSYRFEDLEISGSVNGLLVVGEHVDILDCHVHRLAAFAAPAPPAIRVEAIGGRILDNVIETVPGSGLSLAGLRAGEIRRNVVRDFGTLITDGTGILYEGGAIPSNSMGAIIADNTVSNTPTGDDTGIRILGGNSLVTGNVTHGNGGDGIHVAALQCRLERNLSSGNTGSGFAFGSLQQRAHLEGNQAQGNFGCGLNVNGALGLVYRGNTFSNNTGGSLCGGSGVNAGGNYCDLVPCP